MKKTSSKKEVSVNDLAIMVAKGFESVNQRFDQIDTRFAKIDLRFEKIENKMDVLDENLKATRREILDIGDRFVPRFEFDNLLIRFNKLEQKLLKGK